MSTRSPSGRLSSRKWSRIRKQILTRDGYRCRGCEKAGRLQVHHVQPLYKGGEPYDPANLVTLCGPCHKIEHSLPPSLWQEYRDDLCR